MFETLRRVDAEWKNRGCRAAGAGGPELISLKAPCSRRPVRPGASPGSPQWRCQREPGGRGPHSVCSLTQRGAPYSPAPLTRCFPPPGPGDSEGSGRTPSRTASSGPCAHGRPRLSCQQPQACWPGSREADQATNTSCHGSVSVSCRPPPPRPACGERASCAVPENRVGHRRARGSPDWGLLPGPGTAARVGWCGRA